MDPHGITEQDLADLIPLFYQGARADVQLGPVFAGAIADWPGHLAKLVDFWSSVMLGSGRYKGQPMPVHLRNLDAMTPALFARWLAIWHDVTAQNLPPAKAEALQAKAARIAESLLLGVQFQASRGAVPAYPLTNRLPA